MSQHQLTRHYDTKYAADATSEAPVPLSLDQPLPRDRFAAAVAELPGGSRKARTSWNSAPATA